MPDIIIDWILIIGYQNKHANIRTIPSQYHFEFSAFTAWPVQYNLFSCSTFDLTDNKMFYSYRNIRISLLKGLD